MKFIVISSPDFLAGEDFLISQLMEAGVDTVHLRKPGSDISRCRALLDKLPPSCLSRIVVHYHPSLASHYPLQGVHLSGQDVTRWCEALQKNVSVRSLTGDTDTACYSASCHSLHQVMLLKPVMHHVFLSPIFNSISKQGYLSAFDDATLQRAASDAVIDEKVVALGGVDIRRISQLKAWHFGGAAFLGDVWEKAGTPHFLSHIEALRHALDE
ncbi:MAG: thiamine phosphate synthase [Prevotella sp.]